MFRTFWFGHTEHVFFRTAEYDTRKSHFDTHFVWPLYGNGRAVAVGTVVFIAETFDDEISATNEEANRINTRPHVNMSESNEPVANVDAMENNQDDDGVEPGGNETGAVDKAHENQTGGNDGGDDGEDGDGGACPLDRSRSSSTGPLVLKSGMVLPKCVHKCNDDQYADSRETVRMMMFLISESSEVYECTNARSGTVVLIVL